MKRRQRERRKHDLGSHITFSGSRLNEEDAYDKTNRVAD